MGVLFYFVVRAGFLSSGVSAGEVNRFGIAAVAGLVGMFSVKAGDKLKELFDTLFKTETAAKRCSDESCCRSCKASSRASKSPARNLWMWWHPAVGFVPSSVVKVGNVGRETEFRNPKELSVKLLA